MLSNALNFYFRSVTAISENDVWLAGSYCHWTPGIPGTMTNGAVLGHWNGTTWNITVQGQPTFGFYSIDAINSNDVWAVGSYGWIAHWDGNQWSKIQSPVGYNLWSVAMTSPSDGWATGASQNPSILHWDGSTWEIVGAPSSGGLLDIQMLSSNDGWAVGYGGDILHYTYDTNSSHIFLPLVVR
jgi:hypothetical protein